MVDEMDDVARITGLPDIQRKMMGHALNCRAMAIRCARDVLHKPLAECRLIVLHLGGGGSCRLFIGGRMVDDVRDDEWMFAPERFGGADTQSVIRAVLLRQIHQGSADALCPRERRSAGPSGHFQRR